MVFYFGNLKKLAKSRDFWFAELFLKSIGWYGFSYGFLVVLNVCFVNVLFQVVAGLKFYNCYFIKDHIPKYFCIIGWCPVRQRNQ
jgi:hypothetical protein